MFRNQFTVLFSAAAEVAEVLLRGRRPESTRPWESGRAAIDADASPYFAPKGRIRNGVLSP